MALAPDDASARAATGLARPGPWSGTGACGDLVWGLCAGSGKTPYQAIADLAGPAYRCSCPSRKFPCKHALALLLLWAEGAVPDLPEPADYAQAWLESRSERASKSLSRTSGGGSAASADSGAGVDGSNGATGGGAGAGAGAGRDEVGAARRAEERAQRVAGGLAELVEWLRDQVRVGLAASVSASGAGRGTAGVSPGGVAGGAGAVAGRGGAGAGHAGAGHADAIAARMVDAQAPGVAGVLRGLSLVPGSGDGWPARLLADYARLHLLARAYERLDTLPPGLAAVVRSRVGFTTGRQEVLALPAVTDHWLVLGTRDLVEGTVPGRRLWLLGRDTGRIAMLLTFAAGTGYWQDPETARLRAGTELFADVHYYPGQPPLRALTGERHAGPVAGKRPEPAGDIDALLAGWADGLAADPWLTTWPALLTGTPVPPPVEQSGPWYLVDEAGAAVPLAERDSLWTLLAVSGGHPVTVAGEWHGQTLLPLTVWHHDEAVSL